MGSCRPLLYKNVEKCTCSLGQGKELVQLSSKWSDENVHDYPLLLIASVVMDTHGPLTNGAHGAHSGLDEATCVLRVPHDVRESFECLVRRLVSELHSLAWIAARACGVIEKLTCWRRFECLLILSNFQHLKRKFLNNVFIFRGNTWTIC